MIFVVILTKKNRLIHPLLVLVLFHGNCLWELGNGRGGAAQEIKRDGRILGIIFVVIFFVLVLVYLVGCVAGRTASREHYGDV
jgi:heme/copper-type cytochrome/quinol oxidase subunit 2